LGAVALRGAQWQRLYLRRAMILHAHVGALDDDGGGSSGSGSGSSSSDSPGSGASDGGGGGGRARGRGGSGRLGHDYEVCACEQRGGSLSAARGSLSLKPLSQRLGPPASPPPSGGF